MSYHFFYKVKRKYREARKGFLTLIKKVFIKGNEHQTVMFIPHSESRIFRFKISVFTMFFFFVLLMAVSLFGILAIKRSNDLKISEKKAMEQRNKHLQNVVDLVSRVEPLEKHVSILKNEIDKLKTFSALARPGNILQNSLMDKIDQYENEMKLRLESLKETFDLERIQNDILNMKSKIQGITSTLNNLKELLRVIPSIFPIKGGGFITSGYCSSRDPFRGLGRIHEGIDIILHPGAFILATADGVVRHAEFGGGRGLYVEILHKYGFSTQYLHLSSIKTYPQARVKKGDIIGTLGTTGYSTGPHLHYEVRIQNCPIDPSPYMYLKIFN